MITLSFLTLLMTFHDSFWDLRELAFLIAGAPEHLVQIATGYAEAGNVLVT